jgi:hypothetical protein
MSLIDALIILLPPVAGFTAACLLIWSMKRYQRQLREARAHERVPARS